MGGEEGNHARPRTAACLAGGSVQVEVTTESTRLQRASLDHDSQKLGADDAQHLK